MRKINNGKAGLKKLGIIAVLTMMCIGFTGCGFADEGKTEAKQIEGDLLEVMDQIFANAELSDDFRAGYENFDKNVLTETEYLLGTSEIEFKEGAYAVPMMNVVPFQAVLLRLNEDQDAEEVKAQLLEKADPRKWICVEAEAVEAQNVGNVIFFLMGEKVSVDALMEAFQNL